MIELNDSRPLSPEAVALAVQIGKTLIAEHDGKYSGPWREEKTSRLEKAAELPEPTLKDLFGWMDWTHRMNAMLLVTSRDYEAKQSVREELHKSFYLSASG